MAGGKPAIPTPRALELRAVQNAVDNIRQRIEQIEQTSGFDSTGAINTTNTQLAVLRQQVVALAARVAALEAGGVGGSASDVLTLTAIGDINGFTPVVMVGTANCAAADANDSAHMFAVVGVTLAPVSDGGTVQVRRYGALSVPEAAFIKGRAIYVGDGGLSQHPTYESVAIPVGVAVSTTDMWVSPAWPSLYNPMLSSADGSEYEQFLPVTYAMVQNVLELVNTLFSNPNGIVVLDNGVLVTRELKTEGAADFIIVNPAGDTGNPIFAFPITVSEGVGTLTLAGQVPTALRGANVQPGAGALTLTGYAPSTEADVVASPGAGGLVLTGRAEALDVAFGVGAGAITLTGRAPTASAAVTFLLDTFTGSGTLATHVGEIGATWSNFDLTGFSLTDFKLTGSGEVYLDYLSGTDYGAPGASGAPANDTSDFYLEMDVMTPTNGSSEGLNKFLEAVDNITNYFGVNVGTYQTGGTLYAVGSASASGDSYSATPTAISYDAVHTVRVEVTNIRKTMTWYVDGVQFDTHTLSVAIPSALVAAMEIDTTNSGSTTITAISRVKGGSL